MTEKEFNKRWNRKKADLYDMFIAHGHTEKSAKEGVNSSCFPRSLWRYNQIIGYIQISVSRSDIWFELYRSLDRIYYADSKYRHFIQSLQTNGTHFYAADGNNEYIKNNIKEWLETIEKDYLRKSFYVDYSVFENVIDFIDISAIMKTL